MSPARRRKITLFPSRRKESSHDHADSGSADAPSPQQERPSSSAPPSQRSTPETYAPGTALLDEHPSLLRYRCRTGRPTQEGYFAGATLLHHLAGNPDRGPLPPNILAVASLLLSRGLDATAAEDTIGLLLTSRRASEAGVALPLIDLLVAAGARFETQAPGLLDLPVLNAAPATARALLQRGARMDLRHAAALGDIDALDSLLTPAVEPPQLEEALIFACICGQGEAAIRLCRSGARGDVLLSPGGRTPRTALHEAANRGFLDLVALLLDAGASAAVVEPHWSGKPPPTGLTIGGHPEAAALLRRPSA